jgi:hypothetical protein
MIRALLDQRCHVVAPRVERLALLRQVLVTIVDPSDGIVGVIQQAPDNKSRNAEPS